MLRIPQCQHSKRACGALVDDLQILYRVHAVLHMHNIGVLKGAAHMKDAVHRRDVRQECIAQPLP